MSAYCFFLRGKVERGLKLYAKGYRPPAKGLPQFCEMSFGNSVMQYHQSLSAMSDEDIRYIIARAETYVPGKASDVGSGTDDDDSSGDDGARANIVGLLRRNGQN